MATEKWLIDPTEYEKFLKRYINDFYEIDAPVIAGAVERCWRKLAEQPTVDAVEVVRCKDCIYWNNGICDLHTEVNGVWMNADDYCSKGERKQIEKRNNLEKSVGRI